MKKRTEKTCVICGNDAVKITVCADIVIEKYCEYHAEFLRETAPLPLESVLWHFSRLQAAEMSRLLEHLQDEQHEADDASYIEYDSIYFFSNLQ